MHLKKSGWTGLWLLLRLLWFIKRPVVVPGAWGGECTPMSHPGLAIIVVIVSPCEHCCLKGSVWCVQRLQCWCFHCQTSSELSGAE